jgi:ectoine hydroxylase-related dioxygenase (phytanoyl-CoA dioxygenase family)
MRITRGAFIASDPWWKALTSPEPQLDRVERLMQRETRVGGLPVRVVELSGEAGDVVIGHPWLLHAGASNCGDSPRLMRVQRIHRRPHFPLQP